MKEKIELRPITEEYYKLLIRDFLIINVGAGLALFGMFCLMLLQRFDIVPSFPCIVHDVFRIYCPGCGGTRALFALLHGDVWESLKCNPAVIFGIILVGYYEIAFIITFIKRNGKRYYYPKGTFVYLYLIMIGIFSVIRNALVYTRGIDYLGDFR